MKTYTYKIKSIDENKFNEWIGTCRFLYNSAKELKETLYKQGVNISCYEIQKQLTQAKKEIPFLKKVHSQTLQAIVERLDRAYKSFFNGGGYPKWAKKGKWKTIPFKSVKHIGGNQFSLPKWGNVRVFYSRPIEGALKTARIKKEVDGYYLQVVTDIDANINEHDNQVAIDLGVKYLFVSSAGQFVPNPKHFKKYEKQLRVEQRSLSRKKRGSNNWHKQKRRVQQCYLKLRRARKDFLHKASTNLARQNSTIFIEDLNVVGMAKSRLAKHIYDCGWSMFVKMLEYKTNVVKVDPKYTSQECSECGHIARENRLTQSEFECVKCGHAANADFQASINILKRGQSLLCDNVAQ